MAPDRWSPPMAPDWIGDRTLGREHTRQSRSFKTPEVFSRALAIMMSGTGTGIEEDDQEWEVVRLEWWRTSVMRTRNAPGRHSCLY
jgi:hypothetical protein